MDQDAFPGDRHHMKGTPVLAGSDGTGIIDKGVISPSPALCKVLEGTGFSKRPDIGSGRIKSPSGIVHTGIHHLCRIIGTGIRACGYIGILAGLDIFHALFQGSLIAVDQILRSLRALGHGI